MPVFLTQASLISVTFVALVQSCFYLCYVLVGEFTLNWTD